MLKKVLRCHYGIKSKWCYSLQEIPLSGIETVEIKRVRENPLLSRNETIRFPKYGPKVAATFLNFWILFSYYWESRSGQFMVDEGIVETSLMISGERVEAAG